MRNKISELWAYILTDYLETKLLLTERKMLFDKIFENLSRGFLIEAIKVWKREKIILSQAAPQWQKQNDLKIQCVCNYIVYVKKKCFFFTH